MAKLRDKAVCVVSVDEVEAWRRHGSEPNCAEHRHITEREARLYVQPPRTMTDEEEERFFQVASSRPEWELVYCFALLSVNVGAAGCEMRGLRIGDVDLLNQRITIRRDSAKNKYRVRRVPLVASAMWAAQRLLEIAASKGARAPHHFLFPFRAKRNQWDPTRPMTNSGIKKPWLELRKAAGLDWLTPHCLRHQANTKLYEAGADDMTVMSIMGHQTRQMSEHYSQIRERRKREALEAAFEPSYRSTLVAPKKTEEASEQPARRSAHGWRNISRERTPICF